MMVDEDFLAISLFHQRSEQTLSIMGIEITHYDQIRIGNQTAAIGIMLSEDGSLLQTRKER